MRAGDRPVSVDANERHSPRCPGIDSRGTWRRCPTCSQRKGQDVTVDNAPPKAGRREWIALAILALPTLLVTLDLNVQLLALPHIAADLQAGPVEQLWITDIYAFIVAGLTVTMGHVGDRFGRRKVLLISAAVFVAASLLCAFATTVPMLIIARALLGAAGAALTPLTLALIIGLCLTLYIQFKKAKWL